MHIAILDDYQNAVSGLACFSLLHEHQVTVYTDSPTDEELCRRLQDKEALVLIRERTVINDALLSRLPRLKLISQTGKISNHIDLDACAVHGVAVVDGIGSPIAPAELCWALIMAASRHIVPYALQLQQGRWQQSGVAGLGRSLHGLTLGIWGYGKIGQRIAQYGKAFGMKIVVWGSSASQAKAREHGFSAASSKEAFFEQADVVSLHLRLNEATRACVQLDDLLRMKKDALLVNTSRAELIEAQALCAALKKGRPGFAAVDVYTHEPASLEQEPLLGLPNVLCTPHLGYVEQNSYELYFRVAFENLLGFLAGRVSSLTATDTVSIAAPETPSAPAPF